MTDSTFLILLIVALGILAIGFAVFVIAKVQRNSNSLRRDSGAPAWFGIDPALNNPGPASSDQTIHQHEHHHHHHHSNSDAGHHHSPGDSGGGAHHSGGDSGGAFGGGHSDGGGGSGGGHGH